MNSSGSSQPQEPVPELASRSPARPEVLAALWGLALLPLMVALHLHLSLEGAPLTVTAQALAGGESFQHTLVRLVHLPRLAAALITGLGLGVAGALLQGMTRNPLSSPVILGVTSGAKLGLLLLVTLLPVAGSADWAPLGILVAFLGGLLAVGATFLISGGLAATPVRLVLAGLAVTLALTAVADTFGILNEEESAGAFVWSTGNLTQSGWQAVGWSSAVILLAVMLTLPLSRGLDLLGLGEDSAATLGLQTARLRVLTLLLSTLAASAAVALAGPIAFVGLLVPNVLRLLSVRRHVLLLPLAGLWGALLLLLADSLALLLSQQLDRMVAAGTITAVVGTPAVLFLVARLSIFRQSEQASGMPVRQGRTLPYPLVLLGFVVLCCAVFIGGLAIGATSLSPGQVLQALTGATGDTVQSLVVDLRLPRVLVAMGAGAALAVSGLWLQGVVRNPLAGPEMLGITQGAGLFALLTILFLPGTGLIGLQAGSLLGGLSVLLLLLALAARTGMGPERLALTGITLAACLAALSQLLVVEVGLQVGQALVWMAGTTYGRGHEELYSLLPWLSLLLPICWFSARWLDLLQLGRDHALGLGVPVSLARALLLTSATALAAAAVSVVGAVAFVGILAPHAVRLLGPADHKRLLPLAALGGAALLGLADMTGRWIMAPTEIPAGIMTALIGAPYFLFLLVRSRS